jgi:hypothetical protein
VLSFVGFKIKRFLSPALIVHCRKKRLRRPEAECSRTKKPALRGLALMVVVYDAYRITRLSTSETDRFLLAAFASLCHSREGGSPAA